MKNISENEMLSTILKIADTSLAGIKKEISQNEKSIENKDKKYWIFPK